ncbi:PfkB family carbohydrate kinase [Oceanisphaera sp. IT1-181]|uniref:PfkB family carbohydrate kinase n=1 Tax=Oceanisphaera sp. IT1-181 TaxID=3081199 RepID=UPI0029CA1F67|nr:PfkB family carbohydrate kinase [Oceanisphaera sp. IT1-181]
MANIRLLANLNCDRVLALDEPLIAGSRLQYRDQGRRLGGGAANTGIGLLWAGHQARILSRVGNDETGAWLLKTATELGLDISEVEQFSGETGELLVLVDGGGERTILRQHRRPALPSKLPSSIVDCLYVNYEGADAAAYMAGMLDHTLVVSQYPKGGRWSRPCQIMIASYADLSAGLSADLNADLSANVNANLNTGLSGHQDNLWHHAQQLAGDSLQWLVVTRGEQGAEAFSAEQHIQVPAPLVSVVDATGAGDAFAGGLIHGLLEKLPMASALNQASQWAAYALSSTSSIPSERLKHYLHTQGGMLSRG